jgi:hypothetical protein
MKTKASDPPRHEVSAKATLSSVSQIVYRQKVTRRKEDPSEQAPVWWTKQPNSWRISFQNFFPWEKSNLSFKAKGISIKKPAKTKREENLRGRQSNTMTAMVERDHGGRSGSITVGSRAILCLLVACCRLYWELKLWYISWQHPRLFENLKFKN